MQALYYWAFLCIFIHFLKKKTCSAQLWKQNKVDMVFIFKKFE